MAAHDWTFSGNLDSLPIGDGQDFTISAYDETGTCANRVHRSEDPHLTCIGPDTLQQPDIGALTFLPDLTEARFCLTCHDEDHPTE